MPYVVAVAMCIVGLAIIKDVLGAAAAYQTLTLEWLVLLCLGIFLIWLGWFVFKETLTKTYTIRRR